MSSNCRKCVCVYAVVYVCVLLIKFSEQLRIIVRTHLIICRFSIEYIIELKSFHVKHLTASCALRRLFIIICLLFLFWFYQITNGCHHWIIIVITKRRYRISCFKVVEVVVVAAWENRWYMQPAASPSPPHRRVVEEQQNTRRGEFTTQAARRHGREGLQYNIEKLVVYAKCSVCFYAGDDWWSVKKIFAKKI